MIKRANMPASVYKLKTELRNIQIIQIPNWDSCFVDIICSKS